MSCRRRPRRPTWRHCFFPPCAAALLLTAGGFAAAANCPRLRAENWSSLWRGRTRCLVGGHQCVHGSGVHSVQERCGFALQFQILRYVATWPLVLLRKPAAHTQTPGFTRHHTVSHPKAAFCFVAPPVTPIPAAGFSYPLRRVALPCMHSLPLGLVRFSGLSSLFGAARSSSSGVRCGKKEAFCDRDGSPAKGLKSLGPMTITCCSYAVIRGRRRNDAARGYVKLTSPCPSILSAVPGMGRSDRRQYTPAAPFRNHVLFDEHVFAKMNQIRHLIHKLERSGKDVSLSVTPLPRHSQVSHDEIDEKMLPLLCEGDLLERTLELAERNYRRQASSTAAGNAEAVSSILKSPVGCETNPRAAEPEETDMSRGQSGDPACKDDFIRTRGSVTRPCGTDSGESTPLGRAASHVLDPIAQLGRLQRVAPQLLEVAQYHRRRQAKRKVERLLAAMLVGDPGRIDATFSQMAEQKLLDAHLLNLVDELICEAHMKYSVYKAAEAPSEVALKTLKKRILAHLEMMKLKRQDFVRVLSLCFQTQTDKRRAILKASLYSLEDLVKFQEWLEDGIEFGEETGKLTKEQLQVMRSLVEDCKNANPLNTRFLDRWQEDNAFQSDLNLEAAWDALPETSCSGLPADAQRSGDRR
ncbi:transmembrane protein [Cystoisospora suis]|uniref:Transmembrane protein n=1 Tax=Cystoisospora suis TaxID=483139 RepID=A0A2C6L982_9APIC|nr:transmembrane protein [Cystoisospora suis]